MMDKAEKTYIPALRFLGFDSHWNEVTLSNVAKVIDCKHRTPPYIDDGVPVISPGSISWGKLDLISPTKRVSNSEYESLMDHCVPKYGDLVFSRNQSMGIASYVENDTKFVLGQDTVLIQSEEDSFFTYYHLQSTDTQNQISRLSGGSTFSRINLADIRKLKLLFPNKREEQRKIAAFLGSVDAKLDALRRKRDMLAEYKRGVMQKLFTQEIRFVGDDGRPFPEWEVKKLKELTTLITKGTTPTSVGYGYTEVGVNFIKTENILQGGEIRIEETPKISEECDNLLKRSRLQKHDILFSIAGTLGRTAIVQGKDLPANTNQALCIVRLSPNQNHIFVHYTLNLSIVKIYIKRSLSVGAQPNLNLQQVGLLSIPFPSVREQKKIADFLTAIDHKIDAIDQQIKQIETFKKGLLQQMFV